MKETRYSLKEAIKVIYKEELVISASLDGEKFKNNDSKYFFPRYSDEYKDVKFICDFHGWIGHQPFEFYGFAISKNLKKLLEKFNLNSKQFHKTKVLFKDKYYEYFGWELNSGGFDRYVDFEQSTFCEWDDLEKNNSEMFTANNIKEIRKIKRAMGLGF